MQVEQKLSIANKKKFMPNRTTVLFHTFSEKVCRKLSFKHLMLHTFMYREPAISEPHARSKVVNHMQ